MSTYSLVLTSSMQTEGKCPLTPCFLSPVVPAHQYCVDQNHMAGCITTHTWDLSPTPQGKNHRGLRKCLRDVYAHTPDCNHRCRTHWKHSLVLKEWLTCYDSRQSKNKLILVRIELLDVSIQRLHKTLHCLTSDAEKLQSFILQVWKWKYHTFTDTSMKTFEKCKVQKTLVLITEARFENIFLH